VLAGQLMMQPTFVFQPDHRASVRVSRLIIILPFISALQSGRLVQAVAVASTTTTVQCRQKIIINNTFFSRRCDAWSTSTPIKRRITKPLVDAYIQNGSHFHIMAFGLVLSEVQACNCKKNNYVILISYHTYIRHKMI
jgi:hypothetical protein